MGLWEFAAGGMVASSSPALSPDGKVLFVGSDDFKVYALRTKDGSKLWEFATGYHQRTTIVSSPALSADGKALFVGSDRVYGLKTEDGSKLWEFATGDTVDSSPALSPDGKVLYVGSSDYKVYALSTEDGSHIVI